MSGIFVELGHCGYCNEPGCPRCERAGSVKSHTTHAVEDIKDVLRQIERVRKRIEEHGSNEEVHQAAARLKVEAANLALLCRAS